jgi:hypothetical protein
MWQLKSAAQNRDAAAFNEHVDYPRIRESLKGQFSILFANKLGKPVGSDSTTAGVGAAFGAKLGLIMVNRFVDAMVRPEILMRAMQLGRLAPLKGEHTRSAPTKSAGIPDGETGVETKGGKLKWDYERQGMNTVFAYATNPARPDEMNQEKLGLVLQRSGFATWKLVEVRLPAANK